MNEPADEDLFDAVHVLGQCVDFCSHDGPRVGMSVEAHGLWCVSRELCIPLNAHDLNGHRWEIAIELTRAYRQGTYRSTELGGDVQARLVRVSVEPVAGSRDEPGPVIVQLPAGVAPAPWPRACSLLRHTPNSSQLERRRLHVLGGATHLAVR